MGKLHVHTVSVDRFLLGYYSDIVVQWNPTTMCFDIKGDLV